MNLKKWFLAKKLWLRGGMIGAIVCLVLGLFTLFIYFPIINNVYGGMLPNWALLPPMITGHAFPILSHFIIPYGFLCEFTEPVCAHWAAGGVPICAPWTMVDPSTLKSVPGCCLEKTMQPTTACADLSEMVGFFGLILLLFVAYFAIGAIVGLIMQKRKAK